MKRLMPAACGEPEHALGALKRRTDDEALVLGLIGANGRGDMHDGGDALHGLGPALVVEKIGLDQFEARQRFRASLRGNAGPHFAHPWHSERTVPRTR